MKNRIICCAMCLVMLVGCLCGCSEAEKVNKNISKQANYFETGAAYHGLQRSNG